VPILDAAAIFGADDLPPEDFPVSEWGGPVRLRPMSSKDRDDAIKKSTQLGKESAPGAFAAYLLAKCAINETGELLFTGDDTAKLARKNGEVLDRIAQKILDMNGLTEEAVKRKMGERAAG
jgi:hypothetical protein